MVTTRIQTLVSTGKILCMTHPTTIQLQLYLYTFLIFFILMQQRCQTCKQGPPVCCVSWHHTFTITICQIQVQWMVWSNWGETGVFFHNSIKILVTSNALMLRESIFNSGIKSCQMPAGQLVLWGVSWVFEFLIWTWNWKVYIKSTQFQPYNLNCSYVEKFVQTHFSFSSGLLIKSNLGFDVLIKDTSACGQKFPRTKPPAFKKVDSSPFSNLSNTSLCSHITESISYSYASTQGKYCTSVTNQYIGYL